MTAVDANGHVIGKPVSRSTYTNHGSPPPRGGVMTAYVLRTTAADGTSHGGFVWPESGPVIAPDWAPTAKCGAGLHGLLHGVGEGGLLDWSPDARWLVVEIDETTAIDLGGKVKFPAGVVVFCGDQQGATAFLDDHGCSHLPVVGATHTAGYRGTATAGNWGAATAGYRGTATAGNWGAATAGDRGTATAGDGGTATAGDGGAISILWVDGKTYRRAVGVVGNDDALKPGVAYRVERGAFIEVAS